MKAREDRPGGQIVLNYFHQSDQEIERHFLSLCAAHGLILEAFDRCTEGKLAENEQFGKRISRFWRISKQLSDGYRERYPEPEDEKIE